MATQDKQENATISKEAITEGTITTENLNLKNEIFEQEVMTQALSKLFQSSELPTEAMFKISTFVMDYEKAQKVYSQTKQKLVIQYADIDPKTKQKIKILGPNGQIQYMVRDRSQEFNPERDKLLAQDALPKPGIEIKYSQLPKELKVPLVLAQLRKVLKIEEK